MLRSAIQVNVSRAINGHSGAIRLRHPARSAASALPQSNLQKTPTETANELKAFIISNSLNAVPKAIHCHSLKRFCALYPGLDLATVRAAIEGSSILRWNKRSRGQSFVELVPDAVCGPTIRDVVFPKPPSMEDISAALLALRNHISAHYFHLSHVCMSARFVSKFLNSHLGISQYLVSSSMIKTHGESFGLRWSQRSNSSRIELSVPTMAKELSQQLSDLRSFINARPGHVIDAEELAKFNFQSDNRILIHKSHVIELGAAHGLLWQSSANTEGKILCIPISPKTVNSHSEGDGPLTVTASPTEAAVDQPMTKSKIFSTNPVVQTPTDAKDASAAAASLRRYIIEHHSANQHTTTWDWLISSSVKAAIPEFSARFDQLYKLKQYVELNPQCGLRVNKCHIKAIMDPPGHDCDVHIGSGPPGSSYMAFDTNGTLLTSPMPFQKADNIILAQPVQYTEAGFEAILAILPKRIADTFSQQKDYLSTIELVLDVGRLPLIRVLVSKTGSVATSTDRNLPVSEVTMADINSICTHHSMGKFGSGNRAGIDRTLHRISRKLNGQNEVIGLTMRVGRMLKGSTSLISDLIASRSSMLFLGCPGVGKTSVLRECARLLAKNKLRVEVIDTSNEIAGDCDIPHVAIGKARRMMVKRREDQHKTMIEAVQNHMPQCIIVDEIGTYSEALAAADIAQRGVQIVATAHGTQIKHLLRSPQLNRLVGGVHTVVVGDKDKEKKGLNKKSVEERIAAPVFDAIVEMHSAHEWAIFKNVDKVVDAILGMQPFSYELRKRDHNTGVMSIIKECKN